jgi:hypothetical protein
MKIEDLVELLNNRLNSFKQRRDYAIMAGDMERANIAEEEITGILDTLYKLNLLIDASKTALDTETNITDVITSNSIGIINGYDITSYATDPLHEQKIRKILSYMPQMNNALDIDEYINKKAESSPVTGYMILSAANTYAVDARLMMAIMEQDSHFGTRGIAVRTLNPGNVGNNDDGDTRTYPSWEEGVIAVAKWLNSHRRNENEPKPKIIIPEPKPEPVEPDPIIPEPDPINPDPIEPDPEPVEPDPEPVEPDPEPEPDPINPDPIEPDPELVEPDPEPVEPDPEPDPDPINPDPIEPDPEPVEPEPIIPEPVEPDPGSENIEPEPVSMTEEISINKKRRKSLNFI